ncbi:50S ribosomal protein L25 [Sporolactobacillus spathodeae]|uniref:Large ribosomal subunit protein bL25 n=1 Tax=Sporolactobacillus spathodeae TaxID=1465502 RepID=A0ABS2QCE1_9BACL|nr:50S ribosomal protein L25 [Sporolactobacillus spathodeae]MBM7658824.1 large subunit ribosomal protein L25 [Sporolactobacillus spathodeae]
MALLAAAVRDSSKKSVTHALRKEGKVPSVVYGKTVGNQSIVVNAGEVSKLLHSEGRNAVISLDIEGKKSYTVMAHEMQYDPIKGSIQHIDFLEINLHEKIDAVVPVELDNTEAFEGSDAVLNHTISELTVRALPNDLPSAIHVDVSKLSVGDSIRISDVNPDADYTIIGDPEDVIVSLSHGEADEAAEETTADTTAEAQETPAE